MHMINFDRSIVISSLIATALQCATLTTAWAQEVPTEKERASASAASTACEKQVPAIKPQDDRKRNIPARSAGTKVENQTLNLFCDNRLVGGQVIGQDGIGNGNNDQKPEGTVAGSSQPPATSPEGKDDGTKGNSCCSPTSENCCGDSQREQAGNDSLAAKARTLWELPLSTAINIAAFLLAFVMGFIILWLTSKLAFIAYVYMKHRLRRTSWENEIASPLPFQKKLLDNLVKACLTEDKAPVAIALKGTWGSGKTTLIRLFRKKIRCDSNTDKARAVAVYVNVWQHESDPLPEFALYREIAREWHILKSGLAWTTVPTLRLLATLIPRGWKMAMEFGSVKVEMDDPNKNLTPPTVQWQSHLKSLTAASGKKIIVILDDLDRCSPLVAQRFLTLARRFLSIPNVVTIIPYVEEQLRYKVFNPIQAMLPDMAGTMEAILWEAFSGTLNPSEILDGAEGKENQSTCGGDGALARVRKHLAHKFLTETPGWRERIYGLGEDKYLADRIIPIDGFDGEDLATIISIHWKAREWVTDSLNISESEAKQLNEGNSKDWLKFKPYDNGKTLGEIIASLWSSALANLPSKPSIRQLFSALDDMIAKTPTLSTKTQDQKFHYALCVIFLTVRYSHQRVHVKADKP